MSLLKSFTIQEGQETNVVIQLLLSMYSEQLSINRMLLEDLAKREIEDPEVLREAYLKNADKYRMNIIEGLFAEYGTLPTDQIKD